MRKKQQLSKKLPLTLDELEQSLQEVFTNNSDLLFSRYQHYGKKFAVFYIPYIVESGKVEEFILSPLLKREMKWTNLTILNEIPLGSGETARKWRNADFIRRGFRKGRKGTSVYLYRRGKEGYFLCPP
ncbi:hypothetical protein ACA29_14025 [Lederbergia galactosidilytica]|uniref:Uncharacterized protein n=1 Tax=Lederbergia galactosidilytica TaxID=217031 RepID=A0A0Q9Y2J2_9BACI|nr:hypothetical protein ACA29_14025 [Lederbergia galactosidilytica]